MHVIKTRLPGACLIKLDAVHDERGSFERSFCRREFEAYGLCPHVAQCNVSVNHQAGTLRGLHLQRPPYQEAKLVRVTVGAVYDVIVDLRPSSPTFLQHFAVELTAAGRLMTYVPEGCAHGFQTLDAGTEVFYQISEFHAPTAASGVRWDDEAFNIRWPLKVSIISERDAHYPDFQGTTDARLQPVSLNHPAQIGS
jgi:dTDP-4-dehydrorhamnose 3,5-epimerase